MIVEVAWGDLFTYFMGGFDFKAGMVNDGTMGEPSKVEVKVIYFM